MATFLEIHYRFTNDYSLYRIIPDFLIHFINVTYLYEMLFYNVDLPHKIHHIISIILQQYCINTNFLNNAWHIRLASSGYTTFITSVLSSSRDIIRYNYPQYNNLYRFYFIKLVCKININ